MIPEDIRDFQKTLTLISIGYLDQILGLESRKNQGLFLPGSRLWFLIFYLYRYQQL